MTDASSEIMPSSARSRSLRQVKRFAGFAVIPLLAALTLTAWVFASPVGASPDDDFHAVSAWCAGPTAAQTCQPVAGEPRLREIARALTLSACYVANPDASAGCQKDIFSNILDDTGTSKRGNFYAGGYPPVYYSVIGQFTTLDVQASVLTIRLVNIAVFLAFAVSLFWLLPPRLKPALVGGWLITTVPVGLFIIASINPGSWGLTGVVSSWLALLGWFESTGRRKIGLGIVFVVATVLAAGARGDAALFAGLGMILVAVFAYRHHRAYWRDLLLPFVMGLVALAFFLTSRQVSSGLKGFSGGSGHAEQQLGDSGLFAYNVLNVPWLWAGTLGDWGLGWIYTDMPRIVPLAAIAAFVVVGATGLGFLTRRKALLIGVMVFALWAIPLYVLQAGRDAVGANVSPRYILPLVVMLGGMLLLQREAGQLRLSRAVRCAVAAALIGAHFVALYVNIRRYVTGLDVGGFDLGANTEWWWTGPIGPNVVWLLGSLAYALLVVMIVRKMNHTTASLIPVGHLETPPRIAS